MCGGHSKNLQEFLEKNYKDDGTEEETIKFTIRTLMQVAESGAKNIEICVTRSDKKREMISSEVVERIVAAIELEEKEKVVVAEAKE